MKLRKLEYKDAPLMLEWMHDSLVVEHLATDFASKTIEDCERFIEHSQYDEENLNLAIADEKDAYLGTVSLKHIDKVAGTAEFAITMRACAMGTGASAFGMSEIIKQGIEQLGLEAIYWCVSKKNQRAIRFYDKRYSKTDIVPETIKSNYTDEQLENFIWYVVKA